ncbi:hypothetical protein EJ08DRAFT_694524 [Tothia fuscella]|uniref:BTB domain-containing protein n=1 Tax=Tothia fuscella TaxID=1048955 RepID=A0A9P4U0J4_9PEZI|nr:hypothetical protein EJ08DRAFT_694524 [Tothia fuscella]
MADTADPQDFSDIHFQIEGGNVIIELGGNRNADLILTSEVLKESNYFNRIFTGRWNDETSSILIQDPNTSKEAKVWKWGLRFIFDVDADGTVTLTKSRAIISKTGDSDRRDADFLPFHRTDNAMVPSRRYWDEKCTIGFAWQRAVQAHQVLFSLLYNRPFQYAEDGDDRMIVVADAILLAEFYGLLRLIALRVNKDFLAWAGLWDDIANPQFYLGLALYLKSEELYGEALRHIVAKYCFHTGHYTLRFPHPARRPYDSDLMDWIDLPLDQLKKLHPPTPNTGWLKETYRGTFLQKADQKKGFGLYRSKKQRLEFLTRSVFVEWLNNEILKTRYIEPYDLTTPKACQSAYPNLLWGPCKTILAAADALALKGNDFSIFGPHKPVKRLAKMFSLNLRDKKDKPIDQDYLHHLFCHILKAAAAAIRSALPSGSGQPEPAKANVNYFTHITIDEEESPWEEGMHEPHHLDDLDHVEDASKGCIEAVFGVEVESEIVENEMSGEDPPVYEDGGLEGEEHIELDTTWISGPGSNEPSVNFWGEIEEAGDDEWVD